MPDSIFVVTLGDVFGIGIFVIAVVFVGGVYLFYEGRRRLRVWKKQRKCKHDFEIANLKLMGEVAPGAYAAWQTAGHRCRKCGKEQAKV